MSDISELIEKIEGATEGSRELDAFVRFVVSDDMTRCNFDEGCYHGSCEPPGCGRWLGLHDERRSYPIDWREDERLPHYTTSIDAAMTLYKVKPERVPSDPRKACVEALRQW